MGEELAAPCPMLLPRWETGTRRRGQERDGLLPTFAVVQMLQDSNRKSPEMTESGRGGGSVFKAILGGLLSARRSVKSEAGAAVLASAAMAGRLAS
eukprot:6570887-Prymnesium_polylepis.1